MPRLYPGVRQCPTCGELVPPQNQTFCKRSCKRHSSETRSRIGDVQRGVPKLPRTEEHCRNIAAAHVGVPRPYYKKRSGFKVTVPVTEDQRAERSERARRLWEDPEHRLKVAKARVDRGGQRHKVSKAELQLAEHLVPLGWRHTGGGGFYIRRGAATHAPDFVKPETREIVELWGDYWHAGENPADLISWYRESGWDCTVVWCSQMADYIEGLSA